LERTAYHEAGHAVAAYVFKRPIDKLTIVPDADSYGAAHYRAGWFDHLKPDVQITIRTRERLEAGIVCGLAGTAAEMIFAGPEAEKLAGTDLAQVATCADYLTGGIEEAEAYLKWLVIRTDALLQREPRWSCVEVLAAALLKRRHLSGRRARQIIRSTERSVFATANR